MLIRLVFKCWKFVNHIRKSDIPSCSWQKDIVKIYPKFSVLLFNELSIFYNISFVKLEANFSALHFWYAMRTVNQVCKATSFLPPKTRRSFSRPYFWFLPHFPTIQPPFRVGPQWDITLTRIWYGVRVRLGVLPFTTSKLYTLYFYPNPLPSL